MFYNMEKSGERIRQLRKQSGYTQEQLAKILNVDRSFYSRIESGKNGCSVDLFIRLSALFEVTLDYLILGNETVKALDAAKKEQLWEDIEKLVAHLEQLKQLL